MESDDTFAWYLHSCGIDMAAAYGKYLEALKANPQFILRFLADLYPEEYIAWRAKRRIMGDD